MDRFLEEADGGIVIRRKIRSLTRIVSRSREGERGRERGCSSRGAYNSGGSKERLLASGRPHAVIINSGGMHYRDAGSVGEQPPGTRIYLAPSRHQAFPSMLFANMFFPRSRDAFYTYFFTSNEQTCECTISSRRKRNEFSKEYSDHSWHRFARNNADASS